MAVSKTRKLRLGAFGCESLGRMAAFRTQNLKFDENMEERSGEDVQRQRFFTRLCAVNSYFASNIRFVFSKNLKHAAKLEFTDCYVEITCPKFGVKFTQCEDLVFFLRLIQPFFRIILYSGTYLWRTQLISIVKALIGNNNRYNCFSRETLLCFNKLGNDNAYGTLIEFLAEHVKRIELDDEFVSQLRGENYIYDYCKIKGDRRAEVFYTKSYFDINSKEFDLRNVCTITNMIMYNVQDFNLSPKKQIEKITMSFNENETVENIKKGSDYLRYLAPNLKHLVLAENKGFIFTNPESVYQAACQIKNYFNNNYQKKLALAYSHLNLDVKLEISTYVRHQAAMVKVDWFTEIQKDFPDVKHVVDEHDSPVFQIVIPGDKNGHSMIVHFHVFNHDFNGNNKNNFPHSIPQVFQ